MRTSIVFLLVCVSALAADAEVGLVSTITITNRMGEVQTTETFARGGQTNLVRVTKSQGGGVVFRNHKFYQHGDFVAVMGGSPNPEGFITQPGLPYWVSLEFLPSKDVRVLRIHGEDFRDAFYATNGVYYPAPDSDLGNQDDPPVGTFWFGATVNHKEEYSWDIPYLWDTDSNYWSFAIVTNQTSFNMALGHGEVNWRVPGAWHWNTGSSYPWNGKDITVTLAPNGVAALPFWIPSDAQSFKISFDFKEKGGPLRGRFRSPWMPNVPLGPTGTTPVISANE